MVRHGKLLAMVGLVVTSTVLVGCGRKAAPVPPMAPGRPGAGPPVRAPKAPPVRPAAKPRPASVPAATVERPVALWAESDEPIVDWKGGTGLRYEKLAGARQDTVTLAARVEFNWPAGKKPENATVYVAMPSPGASDRFDLAKVADAVRVVLFFGRTDLIGKGTLVITAGTGENQTYRALSNEVRVPFEVKTVAPPPAPAPAPAAAAPGKSMPKARR